MTDQITPELTFSPVKPDKIKPWSNLTKGQQGHIINAAGVYSEVVGAGPVEIASEIYYAVAEAITRPAPEAPTARAYDLAYAITGGEDAPGLLDSIPTECLVKMIRDERAQHQGWMDAAAKIARAEALREGIDAIQELSFSADTDLECAKLDGLTDATHILEGMIEDIAPTPSRDQELTSPHGDNNPPV